MSATCGSCGARIRWAITAKNGRRIPIDADPVPDGNLQLETESGGFERLIAVPYEPELRPRADRFVSHFATCPNASQHRRRS